MATKFPIEYEMNPKQVAMGAHWMKLRIKNIGADVLTSLDVRLNSLDAYSINVYGTGHYLAVLAPGEEHEIPFQVSASTTTSLYATLDGWREGTPFHWESPYIWITVGQEVAELVSLFAMTKPYLPRGENVRVEATVRGLAHSEGLGLEFWANSPSGEFQQLAIVQTKELDTGEEARYAAEVTPEEKGSYTIYAYLYDDGRRIGRKTDHIYVT